MNSIFVNALLLVYSPSMESAFYALTKINFITKEKPKGYDIKKIFFFKKEISSFDNASLIISMSPRPIKNKR